MSDSTWAYLDDMKRDDLPAMPGAVAAALDEWMFNAHGSASSHHYSGLFLDLLAGHGFVVERSVVAGARSYTTLETAQIDRQSVEPEELTVERIQAEDPTFTMPPDEEAPARSLG